MEPVQRFRSGHIEDDDDGDDDSDDDRPSRKRSRDAAMPAEDEDREDHRHDSSTGSSSASAFTGPTPEYDASQGIYLYNSQDTESLARTDADEEDTREMPDPVEGTAMSLSASFAEEEPVVEVAATSAEQHSADDTPPATMPTVDTRNDDAAPLAADYAEHRQ